MQILPSRLGLYSVILNSPNSHSDSSSIFYSSLSVSLPAPYTPYSGSEMKTSCLRRAGVRATLLISPQMDFLFARASSLCLSRCNPFPISTHQKQRAFSRIFMFSKLLLQIGAWCRFPPAPFQAMICRRSIFTVLNKFPTGFGAKSWNGIKSLR